MVVFITAWIVYLKPLAMAIGYYALVPKVALS